MIPIDDAAAIILAHCPAPTRMEMPLFDALGFALAGGAHRRRGRCRPSHRAMMDGFALVAADTAAAPARLQDGGRRCRPAPPPARPLQPRHRRSSIMTGAPATRRRRRRPEAGGLPGNGRRRGRGPGGRCQRRPARRRPAAPSSPSRSQPARARPRPDSPSDLGGAGHLRPRTACRSYRKPALTARSTPGSELVPASDHARPRRQDPQFRPVYSIASASCRANGFPCEPLRRRGVRRRRRRSASAIRSGGGPARTSVLLTGGVSGGRVTTWCRPP